MKTCFTHNPAVTAYARHLMQHGQAPRYIAVSWETIILSKLTLKQIKEYRIIYAKELDKLGVAAFTKV